MLVSSAIASLLLLVSAAGAEGSAAAGAAEAGKPGADDSAIRCRKLEVTGSLIRKVRVCKTNAEWRAMSEQQNREAEELVERNRALGAPAN